MGNLSISKVMTVVVSVLTNDFFFFSLEDVTNKYVYRLYLFFSYRICYLPVT